MFIDILIFFSISQPISVFFCIKSEKRSSRTLKNNLRLHNHVKFFSKPKIISYFYTITKVLDTGNISSLNLYFYKFSHPNNCQVPLIKQHVTHLTQTVFTFQHIVLYIDPIILQTFNYSTP